MTRQPVAEQGWDSVTEIVDDVWIERRPRRPEVRPALEREVRLMARIASALPLDVPVPIELEATTELPWRVRHRLVPGAPVDPAELTADDGGRVGHFLRVLHDLDPSEYADAGLGVAADRLEAIDRMGRDVLPLLPEDHRPAGVGLLARCRTPSPLTIVHGDVGPSHLLVTDGRVSGVIDWTDVALHDPALDLAWVLHGTPAPFVDGLVAAYRPSEAERGRARDHHRLGPWWEVVHGLDEQVPSFVESGLAGVLDRL